MFKKLVFLGALACIVSCRADPIPSKPESSIDDCLDKDSISCIQLKLYRNVRSFFSQENIELFGGLSLVKNENDDKSVKKERALFDQSESEIVSAKDSDARESALESFTLTNAANFLQQRSLHWNLSPVVSQVSETARSIYDSVPTDMKAKVTEFMTESRGKKKKLMKALVPLLIGLKLKLSAFAVLAYFIIALIAKKAILASLISLAISGFIAIKKLLSQHHVPHHVEEHHGHGWAPSSGGGGGGWDSYGAHSDAHGSYSNNVAHTLAYGGQKGQVRRR